MEGEAGSARAQDRQAVTLQPRRQVPRCRPTPPPSWARTAPQGPRVCALARRAGSTASWRRARPGSTPRLPSHPVRVSGSAGRRLSMRRSEGEAKCWHRACALPRHTRLRGSLSMLGEDRRGPAHA